MRDSPYERALGTSDSEELEHAIYHVMVSRLEAILDLSPCDAIKLSDSLTRGVVDDARRFIESN